MEQANNQKKRGRKPKNINIIKIQDDETLIEGQINKADGQINKAEGKILKKRGRKPKNTENKIILEKDNIPTIEKRGRKPKNIENKIVLELENDVTTIEKKRKRKSKKEVAKNQQPIIMDVDIKLDKEIDFVTGDNSINKLYHEKTNDLINNIWINKYRPQHTSKIIGHKDHINILKKWLSAYDNHTYHAAIISGGHGIGKNLIIKLLLLENEYQIKHICSTDLKNKEIITNIITSCVKTKNVYSSLNNNIEYQKYAIIIDDTESITLKSEKENLLELIKINEKHKYFPIIFISNLQHSKLINNLKKSLLEINLHQINIEHIKEYIINICEKENMIIVDDKIYYQIIQFSQLDIRRLLYILQDLHYTYKNNPITISMFKEYQMLSQKKDIDIGLYYAAKTLLDEYKSINDCLLLYESDKVLLPLMVYENYYKKFIKQKIDTKDLLTIMAEITDSISIGDVIETNIYSDQNWFLQNIHGFYTCVNSSYIINSICNKYKETNPQIKKNDYEISFSVDLNKHSSKNINKKKNIYPLQVKFKNKSIDDMLYINKILYELEKSNSLDKIKIIKNIYELTTKDIQIALKIDKTNDKINDKIIKNLSKI